MRNFDIIYIPFSWILFYRYTTILIISKIYRRNHLLQMPNNNYVISFECCLNLNKLVRRLLKYIADFIIHTWRFHWFNKWVQSISQIHQSICTDSQWKTYSCCHKWIVTANQWPFTDSGLESNVYIFEKLFILIIIWHNFYSTKSLLNLIYIFLNYHL